MSDTSQGPGWWLASDGKWYPPEAWTGPTGQSDATYQTAGVPPQSMPGPTTPTAYPGTAPNTGYPGYPPSAGYGYPGYPQGSYGYGHPVALAPNNGLAIASLACTCAGIIPFLFGIPCVLGIIFGFVARNQIARSNPRQRGEGLALAGIIVGFSLIALFIIFVIVLASVNHNQNCYGSGC